MHPVFRTGATLPPPGDHRHSTCPIRVELGGCSPSISEVAVKVRNVARVGVLTALTTALGFTAPTLSAPESIAAPKPEAARRLENRLPACPVGRASTRPPTGPAGPGAPRACRATGHILESSVQLTRPGQGAFTPSGYHHLGANSAGEWGGVSGRMSVVDGSVRPGSYDFVAGRFMVKRNMGGGRISWLEAGWAETGWAGPGRQHIYTFNTNTKTWQFHDQFALRPGERLWFDLHSSGHGVWSAWLWWNNRWNLLTAQQLPIGNTAFVEQYVEVHVDSGRPTRIGVPEVTVDNVQLRPADGSASRYWRSDVPTLTGWDPAKQQRSGNFCLTWINRYDTWRAGDCGDGGQGGGGLLTPPTPTVQATLPGVAEVVAPSPSPSATPAVSSAAPVPAPSGAVRSSSPVPSRSPLLNRLLGR
jgi:hypothetical protein